jgi:alcohol dehydrogenase class IV
LTPIAPFAFASPGDIRFGRGQAAGAAGLALGFGRRVVLVHGASRDRAGWLIRDLTDKGADVTAIACAHEPTLPALQQALRRVRAEPCDVVIALGGGSVIDMAKALAALAPGDSDPLDHLEIVGRGTPLRHAPLPCIALPTTAGTGAEVTRNAVIGVPDKGCKVSLRDARMIPDIAIVDPALMQGAPRSVILAAGLDAITQVIEPYVCTRASPMTDALCRPAIPTGLGALIRLMEHETPEAWDAMAWVSLCGGLALANSGLGAVHGLAGVIGGATGAAHGAICGALLPHVLDANLAASAEGSETRRRLNWVTRQISDALGPRPLSGWARDNGLPRLGSLGVTPQARPGLARAALAASSMRANPVALGENDLVAILAAAG